jgi:ATP-dependent DNA ligase
MPDYIVHKAVELANLSASAKKKLTDTSWIISPKYDGCHVVFCFSGTEFMGAYSRTGEFVRSMNHVAQYLLDHYSDFLARHERVAFAGEAWSALPFNVLSGLFRKHTQSSNLGFVPFDLLEWGYNDTTFEPAPIWLCGFQDRVYSQRLGMLQTERKVSPSNVLYPLYTLFEGTLEEALGAAAAKANELKELGFYDGAILARADGKYKVGSGAGGEFIKCKPLVSHSVVVTGADCATGDKTGKHTAALIFTLDGKSQKVSTGLTQAQVDEIATDLDKWVGVAIEVAGMGTTSNGYLREPRFLGIRSDVIT